MSSTPLGNPPNPLKSGMLDICVKGILSKSWQMKQCYLCPAWGDQPERIEAYDIGDNNGKPAKLWKVFSLRGLKKVTAKHKSGDNHLDVITKKDKFCFASKNEIEINEWETYLQGLSIAAANSHPALKAEDSLSQEGSELHGDDSTTSMDVLFDDNILYESADPQMQFEVSVEPNVDTERLKLTGSYFLIVTDFTLSLIDKNIRKPLCIWPYKCIRRYGKTPVMFSIEVGRKSTTGPGCFSFKTTDGWTIFKLAQAKLEKMRQAEMLYVRMQEDVGDSNNESVINRSASLDSDYKDSHKMATERRSFPGPPQQSAMTVDSNRNISHKKDASQDHGTKGQQTKKEKKKADKTKKDKKTSKPKAKLTEGEMKNDKAVHDGKQVLPPVDPTATTRLKHVERKPPPVLAKPCHSSSATKPDLQGTPNPSGCAPNTCSSTPEQLYSRPVGHKSFKHRPFNKAETVRAPPILYEEPDLGDSFVASAGETLNEPDDCYDEVEPIGPPGPARVAQKIGSAGNAPVVKSKPRNKNDPSTTNATYSKVKDKKNAWKTHGIGKELQVEHYSQPNTEDYLYETTEVPTPRHNFPPPITAKDFESEEFVDNNYDHIVVPSAKPRLMLQTDAEEYSTYSQTHVTSPAARPKVEIQSTGHEYEEAVLSLP